MRGVGDHARRERAQQAPAGGAAARVDDAADAVAAFEPELDTAFRVSVEAHPERDEVGEALGRLAAQDLGGAAAHEAAPRRDRVLEVLAGRVLERQRRREPALRPVGRGLGQRQGRDERHPRPLA